MKGLFEVILRVETDEEGLVQVKVHKVKEVIGEEEEDNGNQG